MRGSAAVGGAGRAAAGTRAGAAGAARRGSGWPIAAGEPFAATTAGSGEAAGAEAPRPGGGAGAASAVLGLLALQGGATAVASAPPAARDAAALGWADAMLDDLGALQRSLLGAGAAGASIAILQRMAGRLRDGADSASDAGLRDAARAVALRAEIELARRGWGGSASPA